MNADIAHRLAHYFGMSERYWLDLQVRYDGRGEAKLSQEISKRQSLKYAG
jgi:plasmid maintenance system antidote protein VapI